MKIWLVSIGFMVLMALTAHADGLFSQNQGVQQPEEGSSNRSAVPSSAEQDETIQKMIGQVVQSNPSMSASLYGMKRVLRTRVAMEKYLQSILSDDKGIQGTPSNDEVADDANAVARTAKVDAAMARLEAEKGYNLGLGTDPDPDAPNQSEGTGVDESSMSREEGAYPDVVARADAALEGLKLLIREESRLMDSSNAPSSKEEFLRSQMAVDQLLKQRFGTGIAPGNLNPWNFHMMPQKIKLGINSKQHNEGQSTVKEDPAPIEGLITLPESNKKQKTESSQNAEQPALGNPNQPGGGNSE